MSADEPGYDLVMPFLPVRSKGGPHDDAAYVAGYEMGRLDSYLETASDINMFNGVEYSFTIHSENREQSDLIAMRHGYTAEFACCDSNPEWVEMTIKQGVSL